MMRRLQQLAQLSGPQQRMLARAWMHIPWTLWRLRTQGYDRVRKAIDALPLKHPPQTTPDALCALGEAVNIAARHGPWTCTCLPRSMVLHELLRRQGLDTQLRIGVRRSGNGIKAHAWVEYGGQPINDRTDIAANYLPFNGDPVTTDFRAS